MKKRILSLLLAFLMAFGSLPVPTFAEGESAEPACPTCSMPGCTADHSNWCETCRKDNCGLDHGAAVDVTVCDVCGKEACTCETETTPVDNCPHCEETTADDGTVTHAEDCITLGQCPYCADYTDENDNLVHEYGCVATLCSQCIPTRVDGVLVHQNGCACVYDGSADVGKFLRVKEAFGFDVSDGSHYTISETLLFMAEELTEGSIFRITDWYWDSEDTELWYAVSFYSGGIVEDVAEYWPATPWVLYDYTDPEYAYDPAFAFVPACDACGKPDCTTEHIRCEICGDYDCTAVHLYCEICAGHDCGQDHLFCPACESYDCALTHTFCGYCNAYDCGIDHLGMNKPAQVPVIPDAPAWTAGADVSIVDEDGVPVSGEGLALSPGMRTSLSAWCSTADGPYQWQIRYDAVNDLWANIQGQTGQGILVSPAMILSVLQSRGSAAIRCVVGSGKESLTSAAIPVFIPEPASFAAFARTSGAIPLAGAANPGELEKSYVVVQYQYSDGRTAAASDIAELIPGAAFSSTYRLPAIQGYKATLNTHAFGDRAKIQGDALAVNFAENELTEAYTIFTVTYVPDYVDFRVIHYLQNVGDDYYTEYERETVSTRYKTGDRITESHKTYPGFYHLLYETPTAAADGSTVIEVYYDRYYYLMTFDLGKNGYGVDPVYARYGDGLEIGTPTREGYTFLGWKLNGTGDTIASADMPTAMPTENRKYVAQWQTADTAEVSVVFWGENPNDEGYSYLTTGVVNAEPGTEYTYADGNTVFLVCGKDEHAHTDACLITCGREEHTVHTDACLGCEHVCGLACYRAGYYSLTETQKPSQISDTTRNGIYTYSTYWYGRETKHYYLYLDNKWYCAAEGNWGGGGDTQQITHSCSHTHSSDCYICDYHEHSSDCYSCGLAEHSHDRTCNQTGSGLDSNLWTFKSSETVTVDAAGTSVINVYFDRTEFTLHFRNKNSSEDDFGTITDKWGADIGNRFLAINTKAKGNLWSTKKGGGSPWTSYLQIMPQNDEEYYLNTTSSNEQKAEYYTQNTDGTYSLEYTVTAYYGNDLTISKEDFYEMEGFTYSHGTDGDGGSMPSPESYGDFDGAKFYYNRHKYAIEFYNPTSLLEKKTGIYYESPLDSYDFTPTSDQAPAVYEPGSVQFAGWYLNPECTGDEYIPADHTMPSADKDGATALVVYAKWEPVEYKVNYYLTRDSLTRGENIPAEMARLVEEAVAAGVPRPANDPYTTVFAEDIVKHGAYISNPPDPKVSEGYENIHPRAGYEFINWFYLNEAGEETAFDPENMPVDQDLDLYAKWSANKLCQYKVYFALDENGDGAADTDANGNIIYIAAPVFGSGIAGRTYTFDAKGGEELDAAYRDGYFPTVGSHSIIIDIADEQGTGANSLTFLYQQKDAVPYTVKYLDKATGESVIVNGSAMADKVVSDNKKVVVTENFVYIQGYMPDDYQKTLVVTADGKNEITFYYTKDELHALYVVNHYIQELNTDLTHKGWTKYTDLQSTGDIGEFYSASAITIDGFTLSPSYADDYNVNKKINGATGAELPSIVSNVIATEDNTQISGELTDKGMELNFYYTRNLYPYEFRYLLNGTTTELAEPEVGKAAYDTIVTERAKEIVMDLDGDGINEDYRLYDPTETTKDIHVIVDGPALASDAVVSEGQAEVNVATFYYVRCTQTMTVAKTVVDNSAESDPDMEYGFIFSLLIHAKNGYHRNRYTYTKSDGTTGTLSPEISAPNTLQFTLKAGQNIIIDDLPTAEYSLTELNLPVGYYAAYNTTQENGRYKLTVNEQVNAEVTNTYDPANLTITKTVDVDEPYTNTPEVKEFHFIVAFPGTAKPEASYNYTVKDAYGNVVRNKEGKEIWTASVADKQMTIALEKGWTASFLNLPVGTYTVTEEDYSAKGYESNYKVTGDADYAEGRTTEVSLARGQTQNVEFKNRFPVGDITIEKTVSKEFYGTVWSGDTFTFTVERTTSGRPLIWDNRYQILIDGMEQKATVVDENGKLTVTVTFTQADADNLAAAGSSVKHTLTIKNLPAGTYSVTETSAENGLTRYTTAVEGAAEGAMGKSVVLESGSFTQTVVFTNRCKRPNGTLTLTKELKKAVGYSGSLPVNKRFTFTVALTQQPPADGTSFTIRYDKKFVDENGNETDEALEKTVAMTAGTFSIDIQAGQTVTFADLPIGIYRVTETAMPSYATSFAHIVNGTDVVQEVKKDNGNMYTDIAVEADSTAAIKCTNLYPVDTAELVIQKRVTQNYNRDTLPDAPFTLTVTLDAAANANGKSYKCTVYRADGTVFVTEHDVTVTENSFSVQLSDGQYALVKNLPVCGYTVSEPDHADYDESYAVFVTDAHKAPAEDASAHLSGTAASYTGKLSVGDRDTVVFTNEYKRHLGTLTISKNVAGTTEQDTFIFHISGEGIDMDVTITGSGNVTIYDLPLGEYTVTEDTEWSWRYANSNPVQCVNLNENPDAEVAFTNTHDENRWLNYSANMLNTFGKKEDESEGS